MTKRNLFSEKPLSNRRVAVDGIRMISFAQYEKELFSFLESNFSGIYLETAHENADGYVAVAFERAGQVLLNLFSLLLGRCPVVAENTVYPDEAVTSFLFPRACLTDAAALRDISFHAEAAGCFCEFAEQGESLRMSLHLRLYSECSLAVYASDSGEFFRALERVFFD